MQAVGSSRKVFELIDRQPEVFNDGRIAPDGRNAKIEGRIEFRNVRFFYPTRPNVTVLNVRANHCFPSISSIGPFIHGGARSSGCPGGAQWRRQKFMHWAD